MANILIVDDEGPIREILDRLLSKAGYACTQAANAEEAGKCLREKTFELTLLDINMPGDSGLDFLRFARETFPEMLVIMVTVADDSRSIEEAIGMGAYSYIFKPFEGRQLLLDVKNALHHREIELEKRIYRENLERVLARKMSEVKESEEKFRVITDSAKDAIVMVDDVGKICFWNRAAEEMFGCASKDVYGENFHRKFVPGRYRDAHKSAFLKFRESGEGAAIGKTLELQAIKKNNEVFPVELSLSSVKIKKRWHGIGILRDISERRKPEQRLLESQFLQAKKLESIGQLAAGIAHEINTPIQYVGDNTWFLKEGFQDILRLLQGYESLKQACDPSVNKKMEALSQEINLDYLKEEIPAAIEQSLEGVERVAKIVRAMKEFSHPGIDEKIPTDINRAIENTVTVARNEWKYVAHLEMDLDKALPLVLCLAGELNQVFLNMIINASHAIADVVRDGGNGKGHITIRTLKDSEWVQVRIEDTGKGIPEEIRPRIFDPFFTTKEVGKGTGQGLSIAHNVVVEKHGGTIDVESEVGKGTAFTIRLPLEV